MNSDMVATSLALAVQHSCRGLKEACFAFLSSPSNLKEMMSSDGSQKQLPVRPLGADGKISSS
jgi:speckle-type POZ protein